MRTSFKMFFTSLLLYSSMAAAQATDPLTDNSPALPTDHQVADNLPVGVTTVENGKIYSIVSRFSGKCWDVIDHSLVEGAGVQLWECHGKTNQAFKATLTYKSGFILTPVESNIRLQVENNNLNNGALVVQRAYAAGNNGYFIVRPTATAGVFTVLANHSSRCIDVKDTSPEDGARIQQWACHGKTNQDWIFVEHK